ncbi:SPOR domain-containing protein, partial [Pelagibius sp.]|uniref:SPOR domain-containing protein n=1 Tax=Pelagibius sp. TaxID=1931238 RepID=UPI00261FFE09
QDADELASGDVPVVPEETAAVEPGPGEATQPATADSGEELPASAAVPAPVAEAEPSFDIIRIEPNGQSIIAGRAEPFSEWILLNNSEPIGTVRADINGEWVILPGASLVQGANKFSLVPKSEQGAVELPALQAPAQTQPAEAPPAEASAPEPVQDSVLAPRSDAGPALQATEEASPPVPGVPLPILKPADRPGTPASVAEARLLSDGSYEVQLASVRQSGAADRERARLIDDYPALLGDLDLRVEEARLDGAGIFYRLRTGPIKDLSDARELCRQLELRGQGCLVVVRAAEPAPPPLPRDAERPAQAAPPPPSAPATASTQQAENPN